MKHRTKPERRKHRERKSARRRRDNGWRIDQVHDGGPIGPDMRSATLEEVSAALEGLPADLSWDWAAQRLIPSFPRVRPYPPGSPDAIQTLCGPGLAIGFAVDIGPAFVPVTPSMVETWSVPVADVTARALANLHSLASDVESADIQPGEIDGVPIDWLQTGAHIGSTLVLAPTELGRIFGDSPRAFIAPMRDLLLGLPPDVDLLFAAWIFEEIAEQDPNHLWPRAFHFDGRAITAGSLDDPAHASVASVVEVH